MRRSAKQREPPLRQSMRVLNVELGEALASVRDALESLAAIRPCRSLDDRLARKYASGHCGTAWDPARPQGGEGRTGGELTNRMKGETVNAQHADRIGGNGRSPGTTL